MTLSSKFLTAKFEFVIISRHLVVKKGSKKAQCCWLSAEGVYTWGLAARCTCQSSASDGAFALQVRASPVAPKKYPRVRLRNAHRPEKSSHTVISNFEVSSFSSWKASYHGDYFFSRLNFAHSHLSNGKSDFKQNGTQEGHYNICLENFHIMVCCQPRSS